MESFEKQLNRDETMETGIHCGEAEEQIIKYDYLIVGAVFAQQDRKRGKTVLVVEKRLPIANFHGELYSLPFNMKTFRQMWVVQTSA